MARRSQPRRNWVQRSILMLNVVLIAFSLVAAGVLQYGYGRTSDIRRVELGRSLTPVSDETAVGERIVNILLVGSDSSAGLDPTDPVQIGRQGERFGDVIIVAHIDERTQQVALLSFPRDLWVPLAGTNRSDRINRAFQLGGPALLIETIETSFNLPIHHYVNVDFAGFQGLVEAVGSVEVFFDAPARDWNDNAKPEPRSQTGFFVSKPGCHALDPPTSLAYVRSRYYQTQAADGTWTTDPRSDFGRISRQQDFLRRLMVRAIDLGARNPFVLKNLVDAGLANVAIDDQLTPQLLVDVGATYRSFDPDQLLTYSVPAVDALINGNQVLQPQWAEVEPLLALMRGAPFDDPSTIKLSVVGAINAEPNTAALQREILASLGAAGFVVEQHSVSDVATGLVINHGPDGHAAAVQVALALEASTNLEDVSMQQVDAVRGRSVELRVGQLAQTHDSSESSTGSGSADELPKSNPGNVAQQNSPVDEIGAETPVTTVMTPISPDDTGPAIGIATPTLGDLEADKHDSNGDGLDSTEDACRT